MAIIFSINSHYIQEFKALGHTVYNISLRHAGMYSAKDLMQKNMPAGVQADIFFHAEALAIKIFFMDVHTLPCRTAFWSIDTHLHYGWQMYYARLYDIFLTPHKSFLQHLPPSWQHPNTHRLSQKSDKNPWLSHAQRSHDINFVGRLSGTRPQRELLCQMLKERYDKTNINNISHIEMMQLYANTRILPNESIANEVNFRLMEGASVGACVISSDVGEDQNCLFTPEKEILIYKDLQELEEIIDYCLREPNFCESIGRAAWERVQKEHLAEHKAQQLCKTFFSSNSFSRCDPKHAQDMVNFSFFLARFFNGIAGLQPTEQSPENSFSSYTIPSLALVQKLFLTLKNEAKDSHCTQGKEKVYALLSEADHDLLQNQSESSEELLEHKKMLAVACGGAALHYKDTARSYFYLRQHEKMSHRPPQPMLSCPIETGLSWITALIREKKQCLVGSNYISGCCRTAFDFAFLLRELDLYDMRWVAGMTVLDHVWKRYPAFDHYTVSIR